MASKTAPATSREAKGGKLLPIELDMLAQATGQPRTQVDAWFGPGEPMASVAPEEVKNRRFDYPFSTNLNPRPRSESHENAIDFITLQRMADPTLGGLDLLRLAIETCKDRMAGQKWQIVGRDGKDGGDKAKKITDLLAEPDGIRDFMSWQRMVLEDHYVIDHPAIYLKPTTKGIFLPTPIAGATVKPITWIDGDVPFPPLPAYQRYLKGVAGPQYTLDEMIVRPYNPRPHQIYGMGPVEQSLNIVNLSLRRMLSQTEYYTDGTIPDALLVAPSGMNPDQIQDFQDAWDTVLAGQTAMRRHGRWVPNGTSIESAKVPDLTGAVDEWLARIICWCFSISPQALVKQQNRATAQTAKETSQEEGIEPRKLWFKGLMDTIIRRCYNAPELQFGWRDEEITDPLIKAQVFQIALGGGGSKPWMTPDEVREGYGMDPFTDEQNAAMAPPPPVLPDANTPGGKQGDVKESASSQPPAKDGKVQKKKSSGTLKPIDRDRASVTASVKAIKGIMGAAFAKQKKAALAIADGLIGKVAKASSNDPFAGLSSDKELAKLQADLEKQIKAMAEDGTSEGFDQVAHLISAGEDELLAMLKQANEKAIAWAKEHSAELVTQINETTREGLAALVTRAEEDGLSNDELAGLISDYSGFDDARAELIARTETAFADMQGNLAGWSASGVVEGKRWIVGAGCCEDCQDMEGQAVALDESFDYTGEEVDGPPAHPNCRCDCAPEVMSQAAIDSATEN
jgi:Phage portal protein/Phage Mu protein F like protein